MPTLVTAPTRIPQLRAFVVHTVPVYGSCTAQPLPLIITCARCGFTQHARTPTLPPLPSHPPCTLPHTPFVVYPALYLRFPVWFTCPCRITYTYTGYIYGSLVLWFEPHDTHCTTFTTYYGWTHIVPRTCERRCSPLWDPHWTWTTLPVRPCYTLADPHFPPGPYFPNPSLNWLVPVIVPWLPYRWTLRFVVTLDSRFAGCTAFGYGCRIYPIPPPHPTLFSCVGCHFLPDDTPFDPDVWTRFSLFGAGWYPPHIAPPTACLRTTLWTTDRWTPTTFSVVVDLLPVGFATCRAWTVIAAPLPPL